MPNLINLMLAVTAVQHRPKILFLLHLPPPVHGSSIMGMSIKDSVVVNETFDCNYINLLASKQVAESGKISFRKIFGFAFTFVKTFISLLTKRPELCYLALTSTGKAFYKDLLLIALLKAFRIKRVYHLHNKGVSQYQAKDINRISYQFAFHDAKVILLSKNLYDDVQSFVPKSSIYICPNGMADESLQYDDKHLYDKPLYSIGERNQQLVEPMRLLFLSNLSAAKGVFILLEACALLKAKNILFTCAFIGSEGDITASAFNEKAKQLEISEQVNYFGKRYGSEKHRAFVETDIFVFPTYFETFGLVNLEAMQYSLPVVSTFEGGIPEIIDDTVTGFLVPQRDATALAEKLEILIKNPALRHEMGLAGRRKYEKEFTLEKFEHTFTSILADLTELAQQKQYHTDNSKW